MTALAAKILSMHEKVVHVAFGCGCVRTFHVEHQTTTHRCVTHGDPMISFTEEYQLKVKAA